MGLRGPKPKGKVRLKWSANFAYAIGLIVTDGSLSKNKRVIDFTSKDRVLVETFLHVLEIDTTIGKKTSGTGHVAFRAQVGDMFFYSFLEGIGVTQNKTKTISEVKIPKKYFADFLRGHFDGDGSSYSYFDKRWKNSFMFYISFVSASRKHIYWVQEVNKELYGIFGYVKKVKNKEFYELRYAKKEGLVLAGIMYYNPDVPCLLRKKQKLLKSIDISAQVLKLVDKPA